MMQHPFAWAARATVAIAFLAAAEPPIAQEKPGRVVSLNLCTDQYLLALADPGQIASVSFLAHDRAISFLADEAQNVRTNEGRGEAILFRGADLVLAGGFGAYTKRELLERQGLEVLVLDAWRSLDHGREQIRAVAQRLGHPDRGERLVAAIDAALARAKGIAPQGRSILTAYRRGWVPASDSLISEILRHMGFTLHQDRLGLREGGVARLESLVSMPPDYALMDEVVGRSVDNGSALLMHPALLEAIPVERRLAIPATLTLCGGPATPATIDALVAEVRSKVR